MNKCGREDGHRLWCNDGKVTDERLWKLEKTVERKDLLVKFFGRAPGNGP